jgi:hypothetical protein
VACATPGGDRPGQDEDASAIGEIKSSAHAILVARTSLVLEQCMRALHTDLSGSDTCPAAVPSRRQGRRLSHPRVQGRRACPPGQSPTTATTRGGSAFGGRSREAFRSNAAARRRQRRIVRALTPHRRPADAVMRSQAPSAAVSLATGIAAGPSHRAVGSLASPVWQFAAM